MKNAQNKIRLLLTVLLALSLFCAPACGFAESEGILYDLTINDIVLNIDQGVLKHTFDFTGLDIYTGFGASEAGDRGCLGLGAGITDDYSDNGVGLSLFLDKDKLFFWISDLDKVLSINTNALITESIFNIPADAKPLSSTAARLPKPLTSPNSEFAFEKPNTSYEKPYLENPDGITEEGVETVEIMGRSVSAQKFVCDMNTEQSLALIEETLIALEDDETWKSLLNAYMEMLGPISPEEGGIQPSI